MRGRETWPTVKLIKNSPRTCLRSQCFWRWRWYRTREYVRFALLNIERSNVVISLYKSSSCGIQKRPPHISRLLHTIDTQSYHKVNITKCLLYSAFSATPIAFVCFFVSVPFLVCLHDLRLRDRTRDHCSSFRVSISNLRLSRPFTQTDRHARTHIISSSRLHGINSSRLTLRGCMRVYLYINKR